MPSSCILCPACGKAFHRPPSRLKRSVYCSRECRKAYLSSPEALKRRFLAKADQSAGLFACWPWRGARDKNGCGTFRLAPSSGEYSERAPRMAYRLFVGEIPDGLLICHECDNPECCNPAHLFLGTPADNTRDMVRKGRKAGAILTPEQVREIRRRHVPHQHRINVRLGEEFGVSARVIGAAANRRTWSHLD